MSNVHTSTRGGGGGCMSRDEQTFLWLRTQCHNWADQVGKGQQRQRECLLWCILKIVFKYVSEVSFDVGRLLCCTFLLSTVVMIKCENLKNWKIHRSPKFQGVEPWLILIKVWVSDSASEWVHCNQAGVLMPVYGCVVVWMHLQLQLCSERYCVVPTETEHPHHTSYCTLYLNRVLVLHFCIVKR